MSSPNDIDDRFDDLVRELRSGRTAAPAELRERVHTIVAGAPAPKELRAPFAERFRLRRATLVLVPACAVAAGSFALPRRGSNRFHRRQARSNVSAVRSSATFRSPVK